MNCRGGRREATWPLGKRTLTGPNHRHLPCLALPLLAHVRLLPLLLAMRWRLDFSRASRRASDEEEVEVVEGVTVEAHTGKSPCS